ISALSVFFLQAEDGIRDWSVTGVQTCALPICRSRSWKATATRRGSSRRRARRAALPLPSRIATDSSFSSGSPRRRAASGKSGTRSEERRVGKEGRARGGAEDGEEAGAEDVEQG